MQSLGESVAGAGDHTISAPKFTAEILKGINLKSRPVIQAIHIDATEKDHLFFKGSARRGIYSFSSSFRLAENSEPAFLQAFSEVYEVNSSASGSISILATIEIQANTEPGTWCRQQWRTNSIVSLKVTNLPGEPNNRADKEYRSGVEETFCGTGRWRMFPSADSLSNNVQKAFNKAIIDAASEIALNSF